MQELENASLSPCGNGNNSEVLSLEKQIPLLLRGFSLIEIMVVVTLMAILAGLGTVYFMGRLEQGKITTAQTQAYEIAKACDLYKLQTGSYPTQAEGLEVLVSPTHGPAIMERLPQDPWSRPYNYAIPGVHNPKSVDVWSDGPDGEGGESAVGNWTPETESAK
jgi:general secretion pathway protein G